MDIVCDVAATEMSRRALTKAWLHPAESERASMAWPPWGSAARVATGSWGEGVVELGHVVRGGTRVSVAGAQPAGQPFARAVQKTQQGAETKAVLIGRGGGPAPCQSAR